MLGQTKTVTTTQESWEQLEKALKNRSIIFPTFKSAFLQEGVQSLFRLFPRKLLNNASLNTHFKESDYITNPTEFYWFSHGPSFPFIRIPNQIDFNSSRISYIIEQVNALPPLFEPIEQEIQNWIYYSSAEDALGTLILATPQLSKDTLVHEIGSWNGENLFNLLYHSYLHKKTIAGCIGTDINVLALNIAETTADIMGLSDPFVQFYLANASTPIDLLHLGISYQK